MKKMLIGLMMIMGLMAADSAQARPGARAAAAMVGHSGYGQYVYNNWYVCQNGGTPMWLNAGNNLVTRDVFVPTYPYGGYWTRVQGWVWVPYSGVYCVY